MRFIADEVYLEKHINTIRRAMMTNFVLKGISGLEIDNFFIFHINAQFWVFI